MVTGSSVQGGKGEASILPAWLDNSMRALQTDRPEDIYLSGPKVDSFMRNLQGEVNAVTLDTWMANYSLLDQAMFARATAKVGGETMGVKSARYIGYSAAVRKAAAEVSALTGETWTPDEVQETVWSWARTVFNMAREKGVSAVELLKAGGVTHADIADTPDFAILFTQGVYRNILEKSGYGEQVRKEEAAVAGRREPDGSNAGGRSVLSAEGSGLAQSAFERHILAVAERLDRLKAQRAAAKATSASADA
jgi:hypothetical protein